MLGALIKGFVPGLVGQVLGPVLDLVKQYQAGKITEAELEAGIRRSIVDAFASIEVAWAEATASMFGDLMGAVTKSKTAARAWAIVIYVELAVLTWHQVGIPAYVHFSGSAWPSSGATVDWAYALLALCLGGAAMTSAKGDVAGLAKRLLGRDR